MAICPECEGVFPDETAACLFCSARLVSGPTCPTCQLEHPPGKTNCRVCGGPLSPTRPIVTPVAPRGAATPSLGRPPLPGSPAARTAGAVGPPVTGYSPALPSVAQSASGPAAVVVPPGTPLGVPSPPGAVPPPPLRRTGSVMPAGARAAAIPRPGWCWGAFSLTLFWAIAMQWWLGLLVYVLVGWVGSLWGGLKGHELALDNRHFGSQAEYDAVMDAWNKWGLILFFAQLVMVALAFVAILMMPALLSHSMGQVPPPPASP